MPRDVINPPELPYGPHRIVGKTLQYRRVQAGVTLSRCAEALRLSMTEWSKVERGWRVPTDREMDSFDALMTRGDNRRVDDSDRTP